MLSLDAVDAFYGETQALFDVSLEVGAGRAGRSAGARTCSSRPPTIA
jgi:ABC-type arginine transport system ATPase subunit